MPQSGTYSDSSVRISASLRDYRMVMGQSRGGSGSMHIVFFIHGLTRINTDSKTPEIPFDKIRENQ